MKVLVDSSVLINAQRRPDSRESIELASLLSSSNAVVTGPVIMEYIRGPDLPKISTFLLKGYSLLSVLIQTSKLGLSRED